MTDIVDPTTGNSFSTEESTPATEEVVEEVTAEPEVTTEEVKPETTVTPEPLQIDPLTELEKLTALDPKVRDALKAGYLRQSDYTKKTQEIAESRKAAEAYKHWSPIIDLLEKNPTIANNLFKQNQNPAEVETEIPDDPKEFAKYVKEQTLKEIREEITKERESSDYKQAMSHDIEEAGKLDPRLNTDSSFASQIAGLVKVNFEKDILAGKISVIDATKRALEAHKAYEDSLRQKVLEEMNDKAKKKTMVIPSGSGSPLRTTQKGRVVANMQEAAELAEEELNK